MAPPVSTTTSTEVPGRLPVAISGHAYLIDPAGFERVSLPALREQADTGDEPGERSLNPRGLWRRSQETYHHGAGQLFLDGKDADRARFRASKGIDPWTEGKITLLNETTRLRASNNTNLAVVMATDGGTNLLYVSDGNEVYWTAEPVNLLTDNQASIETDTTGWVAGANTTIARDASQVYNGLASLRLTATGAGTMSANTPTGISGTPVTPNRQYALAAYKRIASGTTTAVLNLYVDWYTSAGVLISSAPTTPSAFAITNSWTQSSPAASALVSPATAAWVAIRLEVTGAGAGEQVFFDGIQFVIGATTAGGGYEAWVDGNINAGQAAQTPTSMTTDGVTVWVALGTSGIHKITGITSTADVPAAPVGGNIGLVSYVNGRLMAAGAIATAAGRNTVWEVVSPLSAPALGNGTTGMLWTHPNSGFEVTFISAGRNCMYIGGNIGGNAEVYRVTINPTDTSLTAPTFATYLPDGETIHALIFYAGGVIMGTGKGIRTATVDGQGNLDYGPLIETTSPVRALEPQGRYVWFGMTNYDSVSTGLGRIDLGYFAASLVPSWASDLMVTGQGNVTSVVTFSRNAFSYAGVEQRVFAVAGLGFYGEDIAKVASGTIETGGIRYSTTERKTTRSVDFRHHVLDGTVAVALKVDEGAYASLGSNTTQGSAGPTSPISTSSAEGETAELRFTLSRPTDGRLVSDLTLTSASTTATSATANFTAADAGRGIVDYAVTPRLAAESRIASVTNSTTVVLTKAALSTGATYAVISSPLLAPDLVRWTLKSLPIPRRDEIFTLPLVMHSYIDSTNGDGARTPQDVLSEISFLKGLERAGTIVKLQIASETHDVFIDAISQQGMHWVDWAGTKVLQGTVVVRAQSVEG